MLGDAKHVGGGQAVHLCTEVRCFDWGAYWAQERSWDRIEPGFFCLLVFFVATFLGCCGVRILRGGGDLARKGMLPGSTAYALLQGKVFGCRLPQRSDPMRHRFFVICPVVQLYSIPTAACGEGAIHHCIFTALNRIFSRSRCILHIIA